MQVKITVGSSFLKIKSEGKRKFEDRSTVLDVRKPSFLGWWNMKTKHNIGLTAPKG